MRYMLISFLRRLNGRIDEIVTMSKKITDKEMESNDVIIDFVDKKVTKCLIEGKEHITDFDSLVKYYRKIYPSLVDQLLTEAVITSKQVASSKKLPGLK